MDAASARASTVEVDRLLSAAPGDPSAEVSAGILEGHAIERAGAYFREHGPRLSRWAHHSVERIVSGSKATLSLSCGSPGRCLRTNDERHSLSGISRRGDWSQGAKRESRISH